LQATFQLLTVQPNLPIVIILFTKHLATNNKQRCQQLLRTYFERRRFARNFKMYGAHKF